MSVEDKHCTFKKKKKKGKRKKVCVCEIKFTVPLFNASETFFIKIALFC